MMEKFKDMSRAKKAAFLCAAVFFIGFFAILELAIWGKLFDDSGRIDPMRLLSAWGLNWALAVSAAMVFISILKADF